MKKIYTLFLGLTLISAVANSQTISAIQTTTAPNGDSPQMGNIVTTTGIVTAVVLNGTAAGTFFIQDGAGAWNGIYIFESGTVVNIGDNVSVTGTVVEFNNTTELGTVTNITIVSSNNALPAATPLTTTNVNQEDYEGVLVSVTNATATSVGATLGFGLWEVNDGSGAIQIDDDIFPYANTAVLNNVYGVTGVVQYSFSTFKILPRDINDIAGAVAPGFVSIFNIQNTTAPNGDSPENGNIVTTKGVVTAVILNGTAAGAFFLQDGAGAWNGLYIFEIGTPVVIGDSVSVTGTVSEFNNTTELVSVSNVTIMNSNNALPAPAALTTIGVNTEDYEGVLVKVTNATATSVGATLGFGLWEVNDGSGAVQVDDDIFPYANIAVLNTAYDVTGVVQYSFSTFKILPRDINDISVATAVNEFDNVTVNVYPNPVIDNINFNMNINNVTVNILDITGKTVKTITSTSKSFNVNLNGLDNGIYFYQVIDKNNNIVATSKFVVSK